MKISMNWLNEYVDLSAYKDQPLKLAEKLTFAGLEVESVEDLSLPFRNVYVGQLLSVEPHPNADRLTQCQVTTGEGVVHPIVCGARNHKKGDKVVVALPGAVLPGDFKIKESKIRGAESKGMLCSEKELNLSEESEGILILPAEAPVGEKFSSYYALDDVIFDINVTANRGDGLSHYGIAREIAALTGEKLRPLDTDFSAYAMAASTSEKMKVELKQPEACPRYAGVWIKNLQVKDSPSWLQSKLKKLGMAPINNVVDITNYVLWAVGQPLHAFDLAHLKGETISVDYASEGEKFVTLTGEELSLKAEHLTIRDSKGPIALAGVMGGQDSGVTESTTEVFLEAAYFKPQLVRRASRYYGIESDSAYRFARGVNVDGVVEGLKLAARLMGELAGGQVSKDWVDLYPQALEPITVTLSKEHFKERLGWEPDFDKAQSVWRALSFQVETGPESFKVTAPSFRTDISVPEDLIEEYARVVGYQNIPEALPPLDQAPTLNDQTYQMARKSASLWAAEGFLEVKNYAFDAGRELRAFVGEEKKLAEAGLKGLGLKWAELQNPLSEDLGTLKPFLSLGVLKNALHNVRRGRSFGRLFEISPVVYGRAEEGGEYKEGLNLAALQWGQLDGLWAPKEPAPVVFELKAAVENFLLGLGAKSWSFQQLSEDAAPDYLHPGQTAALVCEGRKVGVLGTLHPLVQEEKKLRAPAALLELDLMEVFRGRPRVTKFKPLSKFPSVPRDLAFVLPDDVSAAEVAQQIQKTAGQLCRQVRVFDVYTGASLGPGKKSYAFEMIFQDEAKTLDEATIQELQTKIIEQVSDKFNASLR